MYLGFQSVFSMYQYFLALCYWKIVSLFILLDSWSDRWVQSEHKDDLGKFELSAGGFYGDAEKDKGIKTSQDAKFYGLSAKFDKVLNFELIVWCNIIKFFLFNFEDLVRSNFIFSSPMKERT